ncbi:MAG: uroporphyrinogen decarboxylase/cobalamine-independent methonine synthase family protein [Eubacteriales bacterium]
MLNQNDTAILRSLAQRYAEYAALPIQAEKKRLWEKLNTFSMERPLVLFDQLPWNELDVDGSLVCQVSDPYWRGIENALRREIYKWEHMPADMVLNPYILIYRPINYTGYGIASHVTTSVTDVRSDVVGQTYACQFTSMDDIEKIQTPQATVNREYEAMIAEQANELFKGIIEWRFGGMILHLGLWDFITQWMGVEAVYTDIYDNPDLLHGMMERLTAGTALFIEQMNRDGLFDVNVNMCHCSHTFLPGDIDGREPISQNTWAFGLAQLFSSVSPAVTAEFEVPYMKRLFPYFGNMYYGCCDRLDDRIDVVLRMPNIRKLSCSPWSNAEIFASKLPKNIVMSAKPNPALFVSSPFSAEAVKADLIKTMSAAKRYGCNLEFIYKDVSTVKYRPQSLWETAKLAVETAENF